MGTEQSTNPDYHVPSVFHDAINSLAEGFALYDSSHRLIMCNQTYRDMSAPLEHIVQPGVTREYLVRAAAKSGDIVQAAGREEAFISEIMASGTQYTKDILMENTNGISYRVSTHPTGSGGLVVTCRDVTEQTKTEKLIRQVLEACQVPIQVTRVATGEILFSTTATTELFGPVENSRSYYVNPDERAVLLNELREKGWYKDRKAKYVGADGRHFWSSQSARLLEFNGEEVIVSNTRDLTDEIAVQEELKRQREELFQNEKMSALGGLLAGVAHELNNPISVVVGHAEMLSEEVDTPKAMDRVEKIAAAGERCAKIVKTFLAMARQKPSKIENVDINALVSEAVEIAGYGLGKKSATIECDLDEARPEIAVDADQIIQVVINLIVNAGQAIKSSGTGGKVTVSTRLGLRADGRRQVEISVEDDGPGITQENIPRIFEPFFTTKKIGEGTGVGLALCHRIVQSHGGQIGLDSDRQNGCRFFIRLAAQ